jgi:hypothetical protein
MVAMIPERSDSKQGATLKPAALERPATMPGTPRS